jgi:heme/copper-type cytochrome/quinol oxidase subunit 3
MEIPYTVHARPDTGLWNAKIGIWLFLASEVMLFGGLFSAYIFLRLGADYHWPVHELNVKMGCFNTAVLIGSSVTIVMAWAGVKLRNYWMYFVNLLITIICAFVFLGVKFFEYKSKIEHYGVVMKDGTILTGHLPEGGYTINFKADSLSMSTAESEPGYFLRYAVQPSTEHGGAHAETEHAAAAGPVAVDWKTLEFKTDKGEVINLHRDWSRLVKAARSVKPVISTIALTPVLPLQLNAYPKHATYTETSMNFIDGTVVTGKLISDAMHLEVDMVDVRNTPNADKSIAWTLLKDEAWKHQFDEHRAEHLATHKAAHPDVDPLKSDHYLREGLRFTIHGDTAAKNAEAHKTKPGFFDDLPLPLIGAHHHYPAVTVSAKDIERWSNFLPSWNTYYAIYFTITGLHGAHVLAGALVMLYFLVFNSSWFKTDPEHLANRVETGGLFWHFVDLVWIFLFPLLYLL